MSEIITINTEQNLIQTRKVEPFSLFDENYFLLKEVMPEYEEPLPNPSVTKVAERMKLTMKNFNGLGLAANQCGIKLRAFVIGTDQFQIFCINPKVITQSETKAKESEGCLSFPGLSCKIERPSWVEVEFTTENGETKQLKLDGLTARCFLHELDHLNGVRFIEHVGPVALQMAKKKQSKLIKKALRLK